MSADTTYSGWANYQTWNVALWINNDEGSQGYWTERAEDLLRQERADEEGDEREAIIALADEMQAEHEEHQPATTGVYADLLGHALGAVDWYEIASTFIDEAAANID